MSIKVKVNFCCDGSHVGYATSKVQCNAMCEAFAVIVGTSVQQLTVPEGWVKSDCFVLDDEPTSDQPYATKVYCPVHKDTKSW